MTLSRTLQLKTASAIWQRAVKSPKQLVGLLVRAVPLIVGAQSRSWVKAVFVFTKLVTRLHQRQGPRGLALFLKANSLILMRLLAGKKLGNTREAGVAVSVTRRGIPRWIPRMHRIRLLGGDRACIRFYLGLLTLYRVLDFKGKLSLDTITAPGKQIDSQLLTSFELFAKSKLLSWWQKYEVEPVRPDREREDSEFWGQSKDTPWYLRTQRLYPKLAPKYKWIFTSGPNSKYTKMLSVGSLWIDLLALITRPRILEVMDLMRGLVGCLPLSEIPFYEDAVSALRDWDKSRFKYASTTASKETRNSLEGDNPQFDLGALSVVEEPGKKRIVAMVDIWTQWLLYPLHRTLFAYLRKTPTDGTFDQTKPVERLLAEAKQMGRSHFWSFDLSAATDRLPVALQVFVLAAFVCDKYASLWRSLLTERVFRVPKEYWTTYGRKSPENMRGHVTYAVGQPMGAYSSWAMLAMVHHAIVQFAAWRTGHRTWFTWYAVLGDDIVIADEGVANEYVHLMSEFGVGIGFHKSIISDNSSLEFAKRFYYKGEEVTPLSLQGIAVGWLGPGFLPEILSTCEARIGRLISGFQLGKFLGVGFRSSSAADSRPLWKLPKILRSAFILLLRPGAPRGQTNLVSWLCSLSLGGDRVGKIKDSRGLFAIIWKNLVDGQLDPAIQRVRSIAKKLVLKEQPLGERYTTNCRVWFKSVVRSQLVGAARRALDQAGDDLRSAKKAFEQGSGLAKVLSLLNEAEASIQLIPEELLLTRREEESLTPSVQKVLMSKSVARWVKSRSFIRVKESGKHKARTKYAPKISLERGRS